MVVPICVPLMVGHFLQSIPELRTTIIVHIFHNPKHRRCGYLTITSRHVGVKIIEITKDYDMLAILKRFPNEATNHMSLSFTLGTRIRHSRTSLEMHPNHQDLMPCNRRKSCYEMFAHS